MLTLRASRIERVLGMAVPDARGPGDPRAAGLLGRSAKAGDLAIGRVDALASRRFASTSCARSI